jgi:hypothetical protein
MKNNKTKEEKEDEKAMVKLFPLPDIKDYPLWDDYQSELLNIILKREGFLEGCKYLRNNLSH